ncbi:cilia- and flagella-associated protein 43 [Drosophila willistoni]|uniref:cilia- and flagella-associated protein 43 n=1 Tax=Drosophila willistoni TaxID=7260 RepID=UPI000C26C8BA|nr:cilia- and flagella-associated protein 43 [Drosophila willistoni]
MNISSTVCWCNIWDARTITNVGPDVLCIRQGNVAKFIHMPTLTVNYFKAETTSTGLYMSIFTGHNRFPLFAFTESVLRPQILIYKYPEMVRFSTIPSYQLIYTEIRFSEYDLIVGVGGYPMYPLCVYNYRTGNLILEQPTRIPSFHYSLALSNTNLPTIVQFHKQEMSIICYEMCFIEKESYLHKVSEVELGKSYFKSSPHFMCFGDDNGLYVVNDYGEFSQIDIACFLIKSRWIPKSESTENLLRMARPHSLLSHRNGFLISNNSHAYYLKKKGSQGFSVEWNIDHRLRDVNMFVSNLNGEIYAECQLGGIKQVMVEEDTGVLSTVVPTGEPVIAFRILQGLKDECVVLLHSDKVAMVDLQTGHTLCEVPVRGACAIHSHRLIPYVIVGTMDGRLILIHFEKPTQGNVLYELQAETAAVFAMDYHDNCVVFQDQAKALHIVNVEYRPPKMTHYFEMNDDELIKKVFIQSFILVEGPRLLVCIARDRTIKPPGYANEIWIYSWSRDKRLHRRDFALPHDYVSFCVQPPMGRWEQIEILAAVMDSTIFDQYLLNEKNELQLVASTKTPHFGFIIGLGMTKHLLTWGVDGIMVHFRQHKRAKKPFMISRFLKLLFTPKYLVRAKECFNSKFFIILYSNQTLRVMRLPTLADNVRENIELKLPFEQENYIQQTGYHITTIIPISVKMEVKEDFSKADYFKRDKVVALIKEFSAKVTSLIDYDMAMTGKSQGIFKKFCFNYAWLDALTEEAHKLCALERESLEKAIRDQSRIRDWIMRLVTRDAININYKVRSIFADANFESFGMQRKPNMKEFDKYRFYDLEDHMRLSILSMEDMDETALGAQSGHGQSRSLVGDEEEAGGEEEDEEDMKGFHEMKPFVVEGPSVYDHMMAPIFQLQNKNLVTSNQMFNDNCKIRYYLNDPLKQEFNKLFHEAQQLKRETIDNVLNTNGVLMKIYNNMNIMLRLLNMDQFAPPELSVPTLAKDEVIQSIMQVDDSEISAVNRRKRKTIDTGGKKGRLLLWSVEFWARALIVMMDGVIEKLWEEEIKKDIAIPEFVLKKQPHEYTLEDQKIFRAYEEAVNQLNEDRAKYLRILHDNEAKTLDQKSQHILKLNKRVAELMLMKLKYDFALKQNQVRLLNLKIINFSRVQIRKRVHMFRGDIDKLNEYITRYCNLLEYWDKALVDVKTRLETQQTRDRAIERHFRSNFLNTVPHATHEMTKLFKRRPKLPTKLFSSALICIEASHKLSGKQAQRIAFPLPKDIYDFLANIDEIDLQKYCPPQVDLKCWESFVKLRRQKIESELRLKGIGYQMLDCQSYLNNLTKDVAGLKESKTVTQKHMEESTQKYLEVMRNMTLQCTISLGQVEISVMGTTTSLSNSVLMHVDDINEVNHLIKDAGNKKIKAMQRVAIFRRQVIFKEWEHKLFKVNIAYLKYMLDAIEKCKVTIEFLNILRNWEKVKAERQKFMAAGAIERVIEQKIAAFRKHIERINVKIDHLKASTLEVKRSNHAVDSKIERLKVDMTFQNTLRDTMMEERRDREQRERMAQIKTHRQLMENVRRRYAHVLELQTILELLRLRTYPTLGPPLPQCHPPVPEHILSSML